MSQRHQGPRTRWLELACQWCSRKFNTTRRDAKFCGPACRKRVNRMHRASSARFDQVNAAGKLAEAQAALKAVQERIRRHGSAPA